MAIELTRIRYKDLNSRQKKNDNYQKVSAVLADFGFVTMPLARIKLCHGGPSRIHPAHL